MHTGAYLADLFGQPPYLDEDGVNVGHYAYPASDFHHARSPYYTGGYFVRGNYEGIGAVHLRVIDAHTVGAIVQDFDVGGGGASS